MHHKEITTLDLTQGAVQESILVVPQLVSLLIPVPTEMSQMLQAAMEQQAAQM